ncbi:MAG: hypothetical protein AAF380_00565 [Bacteroidota bacterium]
MENTCQKIVEDRKKIMRTQNELNNIYASSISEKISRQENDSLNYYYFISIVAGVVALGIALGIYTQIKRTKLNEKPIDTQINNQR